MGIEETFDSLIKQIPFGQKHKNFVFLCYGNVNYPKLIYKGFKVFNVDGGRNEIQIMSENDFQSILNQVEEAQIVN